MSDAPLVNRVAQSALITLKMETWFPQQPIVEFDLQTFLFKGLILREKDFRESLKNHNWAQYQDQILVVFCSTDAIIPMWAYMLVAKYAQPFAHEVVQGTKSAFLDWHFQRHIANLDVADYVDKPVVVKGCGDEPVPASAYLAITQKLLPVAKSIMFGEPCSTVPIYKKPRPKKA